MASSEDYVCSVSGVSAPPSEHDEGTLSDLPIGWARVSVEIRTENPAFAELEDAQEALVEQQLAMVPPEQREQARPMARTLAAMTSAAYRAMTPRYLTRTEEVEVSAEQLPGVLQALGIEDEAGE